MQLNEKLKKIALIGLGSNEGEKEKNILTAVELLDMDEEIKVCALSPAYETEPVGPSVTPFINACLLISTELEPENLLEKLKSIEKICGRKEGGAWGMPRTVDMDILLYGNTQYRSPKLVIPHPELKNRDFALIPLLDLIPDAVDPVTEKPLRDFLKSAKYKTIIRGPSPIPEKIDYRLIEHTADMGFEVYGNGKKGVLENAAMALSDIIAERAEIEEKIRFDTEIEGNDDYQLLIGILQEVLFLFDSKRFLPVRVTVRLEENTSSGVKNSDSSNSMSPVTAKISLFGEEIQQKNIKRIVKAATYHMIEIECMDKKNNIWKAKVFLDV